MLANRVQDEKAYYGLLTDALVGREELRELLDLLTISETSFFRHPEQFDALKGHLLARPSELAGLAKAYDQDVSDYSFRSVDIGLVLCKAKGYVDKGLYDKTIEVCHTILRRFTTYAETNFILGLAHWEKSDLDGAMRGFRKAIYLEPQFALAHFYLGHVCWQKGRAAEAIRLYRNAMNCLDGDAYCGVLPEIMDVIPREELRRLCGEYLSVYADRTL